MKKVLFVSYAFPPVGGAGVQRPAKFVKYLRKFNWEPIVLTVKNPSVPVVDNSLLSDIPDDIKIYKARTFEPAYERKTVFALNEKVPSLRNFMKTKMLRLVKMLLLPDIQVLWWPGLVWSFIRIINKEKVNSVFVTAPPFSSLVIVVFLCQLMGLPVVVDFRDEWIFTRNNFENTTKNNIVKAIDKYLEKYVISRCSGFVCATKSYVDSILDRHPGANKKNGTVIMNGYDNDDFRGISKKANNSGDRIKIIYSGTVWKATSLKPFIALFKQLFEKYPQFSNKVSLKIIGRVVDSEKEYIVRSNLTDNIEFAGYMSHSEVIHEVVNAHLLLLTLSSDDGAEKIIPAKLFEYMATGNHIIAMIPEGETKNILEEYYAESTSFLSINELGIEDVLMSIVNNIENINYKHSDISVFERQRLTGKLVDVLNSVV